jgi:hypothetical protein
MDALWGLLCGDTRGHALLKGRRGGKPDGCFWGMTLWGKPRACFSKGEKRGKGRWMLYGHDFMGKPIGML